MAANSSPETLQTRIMVRKAPVVDLFEKMQLDVCIELVAVLEAFLRYCFEHVDGKVLKEACHMAVASTV